MATYARSGLVGSKAAGNATAAAAPVLLAQGELKIVMNLIKVMVHYFQLPL
jgi:hypothetical protein